MLPYCIWKWYIAPSGNFISCPINQLTGRGRGRCGWVMRGRETVKWRRRKRETEMGDERKRDRESEMWVMYDVV
jgi:hypothetical protein